MPRPKGSVNKITSEIKEKIVDLVSNVFETLDPNTMTQQEKLKFIQIGLQYVVPRLRSIEQKEPVEEQTFIIEIIDKLEKYDDTELDNAIKNQ
ncbi:hypothetical protein N8308_01610 [Flavobacteriaceae bacterium]|nr:hypothetical protein [Flavobacteriaceae bacterium]